MGISFNRLKLIMGVLKSLYPASLLTMPALIYLTSFTRVISKRIVFLSLVISTVSVRKRQAFIFRARLIS